MKNTKEIRMVVRRGMVKKGDRSNYSKARLAKMVLLYDPEYGELSNTTYGNIDYDSFLIALQAMSNCLKISIWESAKIVKKVRDIAVDEDNFKFFMPSTREVIEALK